MPDRPLPRLAGNRLLTKSLDQDPLGEILRGRRNDGSPADAFELVRRFSGKGIDTAALSAVAKSASVVVGSLKGPGIAKGASVFEAEGFLHLGNEYAPGHSLGRLLEKTVAEGFPVAVDQSLLIVDKIVSALDTAYQFRVDDTRVQHRFVVPAFVWVTEEGEVRLTGFGLGEALHKAAATGPLADAYARYLAPECRGGGKAGKNADAYSATAILLELLTGEKAPLDASPTYLEEATIAAEGSNLPDDLKALLGKGLAKEPAARFESISELKKELSKILFGGAYAPTTFNLAFFMNNLFRGEMEVEAKERAQEELLDPAAFAPRKEAPKPAPAPAPAAPAPPPPAAPSFSSAAPDPSSGGSKGMLFAILGVVVVGGAIAAYFLTRKGGDSGGDGSTASTAASSAPAPPAPSLTSQATSLDPKAFEEEVRKRVAEEMTRIEQQMKSEQDAAKKKEQEKQLAALKAQQAEVIQKQEAAKKAEVTSEGSTKKVDDEAATKKAREAAEAARKLEETLKATERAAQQMTAGASSAPAPAVAPPPPAPAPAPAATEKAIKEGDLVEAGGLDTPPVVVDRPRPNYPRVALMRKSQGIVILSLLVNEKGRVVDVKVLRGAQDTLLNDAAMDAARDYKFEPAVAQGKKVKTWFSETITFKP